jgi:hypothetical protein
VSEEKAPKTTGEAVERLADLAKTREEIHAELRAAHERHQKADERLRAAAVDALASELVQEDRAYTTSKGVLCFSDGTVFILPLEIPAVKEAPTSRK